MGITFITTSVRTWSERDEPYSRSSTLTYGPNPELSPGPVLARKRSCELPMAVELIGPGPDRASSQLVHAPFALHRNSASSPPSLPLWLRYRYLPKYQPVAARDTYLYRWRTGPPTARPSARLAEGRESRPRKSDHLRAVHRIQTSANALRFLHWRGLRSAHAPRSNYPRRPDADQDKSSLAVRHLR